MIKQVLYFGSPSKLSIENSQLKICLHNRLEDGEIVFRPLEDIGVIVLDSPQILITSDAIYRLIKENIAIISCDEKHLPMGLMLNMTGNSLQTERFHYQIQASLPLKKRLWQQTVCSKIYNQGMVLYYQTGIKHRRIFRMIENVKSGDTDNIEAKAASYYWKNLWDDNKNFKRDRFGENPNSLLNYGYSILRSIVGRALVSSGLHPTLGIFHHNKYNPYCLADDVMEPYRPYIDLLVTEIVKNNEDISIENKSIKKDLLSIPHLDVTIEGKQRPLMVAVSETTSSLNRCFSGEERKIRYPEMI